METLATLNRWIAQSESWQTFIDFKIPEERIANPVPETGDTVGQPRSELTVIDPVWGGGKTR